MPHDRKRYLTDIITQKLKFSPVVSIQGARQTGKSFLARELLIGAWPKLVYRTFDKAAERSFAEDSPDTYLSQYAEAKPLVIDEAKKVPAIFDAVKLAVDEKRTPGKFLLLGSTEFSKLTRIRESLTGRVSRALLYPFTATESLHLPLTASVQPFFLNEAPSITRPELLRYTRRGGMPGIFAVHEDKERESLVSDWIDLTVQRDIHLFPGKQADSGLAYRILQNIATAEHPDLATIAKLTNSDRRIVQRHIEMLKTLFVIEELPAHPWGSGKPCYFLCDVALCQFFGASFRRILQTWVLHELNAKKSYTGETKRRYFYFRNNKGSIIDFIEDSPQGISALKIFDTEKFNSKDFYLLRSISKTHPSTKLFVLGASRQSITDEKVQMYPWEALA